MTTTSSDKQSTGQKPVDPKQRTLKDLNSPLREINYRFNLDEVRTDTTTIARLSFVTDKGQQTVSITIPESGVLGIDVESQEEADEIHKRLTWFSSWSMGPTDSMNTHFEEIDSLAVRTLDTGILELGAQKEDYREYFLHGDVLKGLLAVECIDSFSLKSGKAGPQWKTIFYPATDIPRPYVLSEKAIKTKWVPEEGYSALPKRMIKSIPLHFKYWKETNRERRIAIRNHLLSQIQDGHMFVPYSKTYNARFSLYKENSTTNSGYQLLIQADKPYQFSLHASPIEVTEIVARKSEGLNIDTDKRSITELNGQEYKATDWGNCTVYENYDDKMVVEFAGAKCCGKWLLAQQSNKLWDLSLIQRARNRRHSLPPEKVDIIMEMTRENKDRPEIAKAIGFSNQTVWVYQKQLGLI